MTEVLDPNSDAGRYVADALSAFHAEVLTRLRREGKPIPPLPATEPLDPRSEAGRRIADGLARNHALVLERLEREGIPDPCASDEDAGQ